MTIFRRIRAAYRWLMPRSDEPRVPELHQTLGVEAAIRQRLRRLR